ncbi:MAG: ion channel [Gemmatimonadaceae bacterium]
MVLTVGSLYLRYWGTIRQRAGTSLGIALCLLPYFTIFQRLTSNGTGVALVAIATTAMVVSVMIALLGRLSQVWTVANVMSLLSKEPDAAAAKIHLSVNQGNVTKGRIWPAIHTGKIEYMNKTRFYLDLFRIVNVLDFLVLFLAVCAFSATTAYGYSVWHPHAFTGMPPQSNGYLAHFYFVIVSLITLGYGDISPNTGVGGQWFGIGLCLESLLLVLFGVSLVVSQNYYVLAKFEREVDDQLSENWEMIQLGDDHRPC